MNVNFTTTGLVRPRSDDPNDNVKMTIRRPSMAGPAWLRLHTGLREDTKFGHRDWGLAGWIWPCWMMSDDGFLRCDDWGLNGSVQCN